MDEQERAEVEKWASGELRASTGHLVLTPERCVEMGGHCWKEGWEFATPGWFGSSIPNPAIWKRTCKHCGKRQIGTPQESIDWRDA